MATEFQRRKFTAYFNRLDFDGDGTLEQKDYEQVSGSVAAGMGYSPDSREYEVIYSLAMECWGAIQQLDADGDDKVTFDEAIQGYEQASDTIQDSILSWVRLLDADGDGRISTEEYIQGLTGYLDPATASEIFARMDADGDGYLSKEELRRLSDEWIHSDDPNAPGNMLLGPY